MSEDKEAKRALLGKKMYELFVREEIEYSQTVVAYSKEEAVEKFDRDNAEELNYESTYEGAKEIEWDEDYADE